MTEHCVKWEPVGDVSWPCFEMSFERRGTGRGINVVMHFSLTRRAPALDLELKFSDPVAFRWIDESYAHGSIPASNALPTLEGRFAKPWTFPLLKVIESSWLRTLGDAVNGARPEHFVLVAMRDVLHVAAKPEVLARWVPPRDA